MSRLCSMKEIPNLSLTTYFMLFLKYLLNGYDAISSCLCKSLLRPKIAYDLKITCTTLEIDEMLSAQNPVTKSWAVTLLFLGMDCVFFLGIGNNCFLNFCCNSVTWPAIYYMRCLIHKPVTVFMANTAKVNSQHYPEVGLEHQRCLR